MMRLQIVLAGGVIVLAGLAAYSSSFRGTFFFDDSEAILQNSTIRHLWPIGPVLLPPSHGETVSGRPILNLSFAINYALSGTEVWGYHATNLAIHLFNGLLLLGILRRTFLLPALRPRFGRAALFLASLIALLWIVHPLQTESVTYIVQRAESLAALFYLLALYAVIRGSQSGRSTTVWYLAAVGACWLGMATKETVVTAPIMVLLYDRTLLAGTFRQAWRQRWKLHLGLAASWILLVGLMFQRGFVVAFTPNSPDLWSYARSQPGVILFYLRQAVWPYPLSLDWNWQPVETWSAIYLPAMVVGLLWAATIWGLYRGRWGLLGAWFFLILAPSSSIVPLVQLACEHRMYLPLAAVITLLVIGAYLVGQRWIVFGLVIPVAIVLGFLTFQRNLEYRDEFMLLADRAKKPPGHPENPGAYNNWGLALLKAGRPQEAQKRFEQALRMNPNLVEALNNMGNVLSALGQPAEALAYYEQTLRLNPNHVEAHNNMGNVLSMLGRPTEALAYYEQTLQLNPNYADAHRNWGTALAMLGRWSEAVEQYQQFLRITPDSAIVHFNLAIALSHVGRLDEALEHGREAVRLMPDNPQIKQGMAGFEALRKSTGP